MAQHIGQETSMEEILSSIKRVIQEGGDRMPRRGALSDMPVGRETPVPAPDEDDGDEHEVLELTQAVDPGETIADDGPLVADPEARDAAADWQRVAAGPAAGPADDGAIRESETPARAPRGEDEEDGNPTLVSATTVEASRAALASLGRIVVKEAGQDVTLEAMVREMLRPMLQRWLDANLPGIVERLVAAEVARITRDTN